MWCMYYLCLTTTKADSSSSAPLSVQVWLRRETRTMGRGDNKNNEFGIFVRLYINNLLVLLPTRHALCDGNVHFQNSGELKMIDDQWETWSVNKKVTDETFRNSIMDSDRIIIIIGALTDR